MVELFRTPAWEAIQMPSNAAVKIVAEDLRLALLRLAPGGSADGLPGPRQAAESWLNIAPRDWLYCGLDCPRPDALDMSDALVALRIDGAGAVDLLSNGVFVDWRAFPPGSCARMRLGEIAVVLHREGDQSFRLIVAAPYARYLAEWMARHV
jgi:hypothetical protein